jgi:anti-sigma B factor antagonist
MNVDIADQGSRTLVKIEGRIDTNNSYELEKAVAPLLGKENPDVEIDCEKLEYISSSGLRVFLAMEKGIKAKGGNLVLTGMNEWVMEIFKITGFDTIFNIK